jgi:hypothetical protein
LVPKFPLRPRWSELVARAPLWYVHFWSQEKNFGIKVLQEFSRITPTVDNGTNQFLKFLARVDSQAPEILPLPVSAVV